MGRRRRIWIPKYEGIEAIVREQLGGERELRLLTSRLTGAIKAMETIAKTPELLNRWRRRPFVPTDGIPGYARDALEKMIDAFLASSDDEQQHEHPRQSAAGARPIGARADHHGILQRGGADRLSLVARRPGRQADGLPMVERDGHADGARDRRAAAATKPASSTTARKRSTTKTALRIVRVK